MSSRVCLVSPHLAASAAAAAAEHVHRRIAQVKEAAERQIDELTCAMEAVDIRIAETKKDTYEFKRDIIVGAENPRTGKTVAEKMLRCGAMRCLPHQDEG